MPGIFGDLFDFDGDGKLDCVEQAAEHITFERMMNDNDSNDSYSDEFSDEDDF